MDAELKEKWVKALRGGRYKQARRKLIDQKGGYCCIGVLGRVLGVGRERLKQHAHAVASTYMPELYCLNLGAKHTLSEMNDGVNGQRRHSFKEIADWIEKNL